jgi:excisionase family DNA binding protein
MHEIETIEPLFKPAEVAKILKVSRPYVYRMAEEGVLPCVRWPGMVANLLRVAARLARTF